MKSTLVESNCARDSLFASGSVVFASGIARVIQDHAQQPMPTSNKLIGIFLELLLSYNAWPGIFLFSPYNSCEYIFFSTHVCLSDLCVCKREWFCIRMPSLCFLVGPFLLLFSSVLFSFACVLFLLLFFMPVCLQTRERRGAGMDGRGAGEKLRGAERGESIIRI